MAKVYVKRLGTGEVVHEIEVNPLNWRHHERFMRGLLRNMNADLYYVDDAEVRLEDDAPGRE